jgi:hypothetical protein
MFMNLVNWFQKRLTLFAMRKVIADMNQHSWPRGNQLRETILKYGDVYPSDSEKKTDA